LLHRIESGDIPASEVIVGGEVSTTSEGVRLKALGVAVFAGVKAAVDEARKRIAARETTFAVLANNRGVLV
jgi:CRISPR-associated protein Cst2